MTSPAGGAGAASNGGDAGQGEAQQGEQAGGPDVSALAEQLGQMSEGQEQMRQFLMSQPWSAQQAQEGGEDAGGEPEGLDLSALDDMGYDRDAAQALADTIERQWQQREQSLRSEFDERLNTVDNRISERERLEAMQDLVAEFPDMAKPEVARDIVSQAQTLAEANGWSPELGADPRFWRMNYAAQEFFRLMAEEEGSEQPEAAHLEGGAGASGARAAQQGDDFRQMLDAAAQGGRQSLPFP